MNTTTNHHSTAGSGLGFAKILGIVAVALIVLALLGPIIKGLFWVGLVALAIYGGYTLYRASRGRSGPPPRPPF